MSGFLNIRYTVIIGLVMVAVTGGAAIRITEFLAINSGGRLDEDGVSSDWIEIHNDGAAPVNLGGWRLSDDPAHLTKWVFPSLNLGVNEFLLVFASDKNRTNAFSELHTNFKLDGDGEYLALLMPDGTPATEFAPAYPDQRKNFSYGFAGGFTTNDLFFFSTPTPEADNAGGFIAFAGDTRFSMDRGFYTNAFVVEITSDTPGAQIRYTTDGSAPSETAGTVYSQAIPVSTTTFIRAIAYRSGYVPSNVDTHSYLFLADVLQQDGSNLPPHANWGHSGPDWEVDPDVVNDPRYAQTMTNDLLAVPSISVVMDWDDLWAGGGQGIYIAGEADPRAASFERLSADGTREFQENGSIQIQGQSSTGRWKTNKLSLRAKFTEVFGPTKLRTRLFEDSPVDEFDTFVLDGVLNLSWLHPSSGQRAPAQYIQDQVVADLQNAGGGRAPHGNYVHLYLNGLYWGMYYLHERPDAGFHRSYAGGEKEHWDVFKHSRNEVVDGSVATYNDLVTRMALDQSVPANYAAVQERLDIDDFILYMLCNYYLGNTDWAHKNLYASHNGVSGDGKWRFHSWDAEHVVKNVNQDITNRRDNAGQPTDFHFRMRANAEYNLRFADITHRHFFNGGIMSPEGAVVFYSNRVAQVDRAIVGESARWGDNRDSTPRTRDDDWLPTVTGNINNYFPARTGIVLNQLKNDQLYPGVDAPVFAQHGGAFTKPFGLSMSGGGTIYYTLDGSDPREVGSGNAVGQVYTSPVTLPYSVRVKARVLDGGTWSALNEADFICDEPPPICLSEIMYHASSNEFVEVVNTSAAPFSLLGYAFTDGIEYIFEPLVLAPGEHLVVVDDLTAFQQRYPSFSGVLAGVYAGGLDDGGETVVLENTVLDQQISVRYDNGRLWYPSADGAGHSLVPLSHDPESLDDYSGWWRPSAWIGGSPGEADPAPLRDLLLNEFAANTGTASNDWIEVYNASTGTVVFSNWYLSDDPEQLDQWQIPAGFLNAGFWTGFAQQPSFPFGLNFGLDSDGEQIFLAHLPGGGLDRVADAVAFNGQELARTTGRYPDGNPYWQRMLPTAGSANGVPVMDVRIHEVMYHPVGTNAEYIVLHNPSGASAPLFTGEGPWRIRGEVDFDFPPGITMAGGAYLSIVPFAITNAVAMNAFQSTHGPLGDLVGPFTGKLSNRSGRITLERKQHTGSWVVVDELVYLDRAPWGDSADGTGLALHRLDVLRAGTDHQAWRSGLPSPFDAALEWPAVDLEIAANEQVQFSAHSNLTYTVERTPGLRPPQWEVLETYSGSGLIHHEDLTTGEHSTRYYRVRISE